MFINESNLNNFLILNLRVVKLQKNIEELSKMKKMTRADECLGCMQVKHRIIYILLIA